MNMHPPMIYPVPKDIHVTGSVPFPKAVEVRGLPDSAIGLARRVDAIVLGMGAARDSSDFHLTLSIGPEVHEDWHDAYRLTVAADGISVEGATEAAVFYGLTTLNQWIVGDALRLGSVTDGADTAFRGLIEGYYGIPWTDEDRRSILEFGAQFKMNCYAFAPKDDPYHRERWWEQYPEDQLKVIGDLAAYGEAVYNHYVWTIAPFKAESRPIRAENRDEGLALLIAKFEQLYAAGVRQFGVLGDDVGVLPYDTVVEVMNAVNRWRREKGDVYPLLFCPEGYNMMDWAFKDGTELNIYDNGFDADIEIFFTGIFVCAPLSAYAVDQFKSKAAIGRRRRDPLFWMNWPVNDIDRTEYRRLFMGPGEVYETDVTDITGVLTNPMEEAEASKVALFATLDYAWNISGFDCFRSWEDSFNYLAPECADAYRTICRHMSSVTNGAKPDAVESEDLKAIGARYFSETSDDDARSALRSAYAEIAAAVDTFMARSENRNLVDEIKPYASALKAKAQAAVCYLDARADDVSAEEYRALMEDGDRHRAESQRFEVHTRTSEFPNTVLRAEAGMKVIDPQLQAFAERR